MTKSDTLVEPNSVHADVSQEIEENLLASLAVLNSQSMNSTIVLTKRDSGGKLLAGVSGTTSYGWFLVKLLWVHEEHRRTGVGKTLVQEAEQRAKALGSHGAWLDTSNPKAHEFYLRLGYSDFGKLNNPPGNEPLGHCRWFMKKVLRPE